MIIQTENNELLRDINSRALSPKREALEAFRRERAKQKKVEDLENKVSSLESQVERLIALLETKQ